MSLEPNALPLWTRSLAQRLGPGQRSGLLRALAAVVRQGQVARIRAQQGPDGAAFEPRKPRRRTPRKTGPLFKRAPGRLRIQVDAETARIGWGGRVAEVLRVHQQGLLDRVDRRGPIYQYPERKLLGLTDADLERISEVAIARISGART